MANENEVLTKLHAIRKAMLEESGGTLRGLSDRLRQEESKSAHVITVDDQSNSTLSDPSGAESA